MNDIKLYYHKISKLPKEFKDRYFNNIRGLFTIFTLDMRIKIKLIISIHYLNENATILNLDQPFWI